MKAAWALILVLAFTQTSCAYTADYFIYVNEEGSSLVVIGLYGDGETELKLPLDVVKPHVSGGLYFYTPRGIQVSTTRQEETAVAYRSELLTSENGGSWIFELPLEYSKKHVSAYLPKNARILSTSPQASVSRMQDAVYVSWDLMDYVEAVSAEYELPDQQQAEKAMDEIPDNSLQGYRLILAALIILSTYAAYRNLEGKKRGGR